MIKRFTIWVVLLAGIIVVAPRLSGCAVVHDVRGMVDSASSVIHKLPQQRVERKPAAPLLPLV